MLMSNVTELGSSSSFFDNLRLVEGPDGELNFELPMTKGKKKNVPEYYAFATGRHACSFFLKIEAAFFLLWANDFHGPELCEEYILDD